MKKSAFTLIELLVVIAIIAILAGIMLPVFLKIIEKGRLTADQNNLHQIGLALLSYQNDNGGKMPPDGTAMSFVVSQQGTNQVLWNYAGKSFAVWHSNFDPRQGAEGNSYPVSYSINGKVLLPTAGTPAPGTWSGDLANAAVAPSKLIVASPNFTGRADAGAAAWGNNIASLVQALPNKGTGMTLTGTCYRQMPTLFADSHVEMVPAANYQCTAADNASWIEWDPMHPNVP
ncbi:MAG TPA: prepilin-type N-terminal cleavage/methylation domain-containing protein [Chthoniobacter sp.]|jgi:prepilin-type N-terminal cleavage/methylation domain-containing protein